MSEYQYYEFHSIDRPLTREEMAELRTCSSRARISSTRFTNEYHWGDFKGDRKEWMKRYFDAHLYTSNFGSRVFCLRFPISWIDPETIAAYHVEGALEVSKTRTHLISSSRYQENSIRIIGDLRELASTSGGGAQFREKLEGLVELRSRKSSFMKMMRDAGLA